MKDINLSVKELGALLRAARAQIQRNDKFGMRFPNMESAAEKIDNAIEACEDEYRGTSSPSINLTLCHTWKGNESK